MKFTPETYELLLNLVETYYQNLIEEAKANGKEVTANEYNSERIQVIEEIYSIGCY